MNPVHQGRRADGAPVWPQRLKGRALPYVAVGVGLAIVPLLAWFFNRSQSPRMDLLTRISRVQGWSADQTQLWQRVRDDATANRMPSDEDWSGLVQAANSLDYNYVESLVLELPRHLKGEKYEDEEKKWCTRLMQIPQNTDPYASVVGFTGYLDTNATDKDVWAQQLKSRGGMYVDQIDKAIDRERHRPTG